MKAGDAHRPGLVRRFLGDCVRPYLVLQIEIGLCLLASVILGLVDPLVLRAIIDRALGDGDASLLALLCGLLGLALVFRVLFRLLSVWLYSYSGLVILFRLRQRVFEHVERMSPYFFRGERVGDILARLTADIDVLQRAAAHTVVNAIQDALTIVGILTALCFLDLRLTLVVILVYPPLLGFLVLLNRGLRREGIRAREAMGGLYSFLEERIRGMRLVQEFLREKTEARRHVGVSRPWIRSNLALSLTGAGQVSLADFMTTGALIVVFLLGGHRVLAGTLSLGTLVAFFTLSGRLHRPLSGLVDVNVDLQIARASLGRIYDLLDTPPSIREAEHATSPPSIEGAVHLAGVSARFENGAQALSSVDLTIAPGEVVALVGPSGGGKSTLAALLVRALDPTQGVVQIDGHDLRRWKLGDLRRAVGLVPQETQLFHDTLGANLRMARPRATDAELDEVLRRMELGELLASLPDGLDSLAGEQGLRLSGGERQRLALARALLKKPRIHILDEATSALDVRTERRVLEQFLESTRGATVILIAHRLSTVAGVDRIFVLSEGRIVESGRHEELLEAGGLYAELWREQERKR